MMKMIKYTNKLIRISINIDVNIRNDKIGRIIKVASLYKYLYDNCLLS